MPFLLPLLDPMLVLLVVRGASAVLSAAIVAVGMSVQVVSTLAFVGSALVFVALPYRGVWRRTASSIRRSMLGYAGRARFTVRQRSSAAP
jgi:hypothetical protein